MSNENTEQKVALYQYGDTELWYAEGSDSSWRLPVLVEWRHDKAGDRHFALIIPAVTLYASQVLVMQALLEHHDIYKGKLKWLVLRRTAEALLKKAPGITPIHYYRWPDMACPALPPVWNITKKIGDNLAKDTEQSINSQPFVKHVAEKCNLPSSIVNVVWKAACKEAPEWMLTNSLPLEMGFCQLVALPFRRNWKEIVAYKCKKWRLGKMFNEDRNAAFQKLEELGLPGLLCSTHNIGMSKDRSGTIQYTLEAMQTTAFDKTVRNVEAKRVACGHSNYVAQFEETVEKLYHHIVRALEIHIKKIGAPFAKVSVGRSSGKLRFLPVGNRQVALSGLRVDQLPVHIIPPDSDFSVLSGQSDIRLVQEPAPEVQEVPGFLQAVDDLRRSQGEPDVVEQRPAGDDGVLLRHDKESPAAGEPVLDSPTPAG